MVDEGLAIVGENPLLLATRGLVSWYFVNFSIRPESAISTNAPVSKSKSGNSPPPDG